MKLLLIIFILGAGGWLLARWFERSQMYYPQTTLEYSPRDINLNYNDVYLSAVDGPRIHGWWIPAAESRGSLIFCHGNAGNISHRLESIRIFHDLGLDVLIFDYRGYGKSPGRPSEKGTYGDAEAAYDYLIKERHISPEKIIVFGRSLGGAVAIELARKRKVAALICEASFPSTKEVAKLLYPYLPVWLLISNKYDSISKVGEITVPKIFIHSREDELIPFEQGKKLFLAAAPPRELLEIKGGHGDGFLESEEKYTRAVNDFLKRFLPA